MKYLFLSLFFIFALNISVQAQEDVIDEGSAEVIDLSSDSTIIAEKKSKLFSGRPGKAFLHSLVIPGAGQGVINKKWWKVPLVYAAVGGMGVAMFDNKKTYKRFQDALIAEVNGEEHEFSGRLDSPEAIKPFRDRALRQYENSVIFFAVVWILQAGEAFVDAHLIDFDISDDLSLRVKPVFVPSANQLAGPGLGISLSF